MKKSFWVTSTYFTEGLPYMIVRFISSVYFTDRGVREAYLGFLNFLGIPWNLKFLWAPLVDIFSTKRKWLIRLQLIITLFVFLLSVMAGVANSNNSISILWMMAFLFVGLAFVAATNDIAIDAYYLEGLQDPGDQAAFSGVRTMAYRLAVIYARSILVAIVAATNWFYGFSAGTVTLFVFYLFHKFFLPHFEEEKRGGATSFKKFSADFLESFRIYLSRKKAFMILVFVASYKLGDEILFAMNTPFLMRELMVTKGQLAWLAGIVGSFAAVFGTLLGGWWIKKKGLKKSIWPITIIMNVNILAYLVLSEGKPTASGLGLILIAAVHAYENIAAGLGSAALTVYLMRLCHPKFKAAHFAIGTAIMSLGATFIGGFGGVIVEKLGYTNLFLIGFLAAIPSMLLLKWIPMNDQTA